MFPFWKKPMCIPPFVGTRHPSVSRVCHNNEQIDATRGGLTNLSHEAVSICANAVVTTNSGAKIPRTIHRARLRFLPRRFEFSVGTLRCSADQTHRVKVSTQDAIRSQVPRKLGGSYHEVSCTSAEATVGKKRCAATRNRSMQTIFHDNGWEKQTRKKEA